MKKRILFFITILFAILLLTACTDRPQGEENNACEHEWELTEFVTEETEIPFAGVFKCKKCAKEDTHSFSSEDIDIPLIGITGDLSPIYDNEKELSKETKVEVAFSYKSSALSFDTFASFFYQGKSSKDDPKRNYSVNILDATTGKKKEIRFVDSWGSGSKYVLKANYIDPSSARNIVMASLYGQIAHDRELDDPFSSLVNGGAIDGYPVLFYANGQYQGLYNWNIRKDKWLYGMGDKTAQEAIICGSAVDEYENEAGVSIPTEDGARSAKSWKYEYVNENVGEEGWALNSFNTMIAALKNADNAVLRDEIEEYMILDRTIDVVLFSILFAAADNVGGNQVWCTYNGKKWTPVPYDLDRTLGRDGELLLEADDSLTDCLTYNLLYRLIFQAYYGEIKARYIQLRTEILTTNNVMSIFAQKLQGVDDRYFIAEMQKWENADWRFSDNAEQITGFGAELDYIEKYLDERLAFCDAFFAENDQASILSMLLMNDDIE